MGIEKEKKQLARKIIFLSVLYHQRLKHWKKDALRKQLRNNERKLRKRCGNRIRERQVVLQELRELPGYIFRSIFRVDLKTFDEIKEKIKPYFLKKNESKAKNNIGGKSVKTDVSIGIDLKLMGTLRFLAGGMKWDICLALKLGFGTFFQDSDYGIVWPTLRAIDAAYTIGLDNSAENLANLAKEFAEINSNSTGIFDGVVLAIDGWVMQTRQPYQSEIPSTSTINSFRNRKGVWGIVILAGCDARTKFHLFSAKNTGSTNDCTAWDNSNLKKLIDEGFLPVQFYFIGDEGFSCTNQFLVPWGGNRIGHDKDSFNYHLSVRRQVIERAFGILTRRWGIFWRPIQCSYDKWSLIATCCAKLHNVCIDANTEPTPRYQQHCKRGDENIVYDNIFHEEDTNLPIRSNVENGRRRSDITSELSQLGIRRPLYALHNSRAL
jgi:hypothetical protein